MIQNPDNRLRDMTQDTEECTRNQIPKTKGQKQTLKAAVKDQRPKTRNRNQETWTRKQKPKTKEDWKTGRL